MDEAVAHFNAVVRRRYRLPTTTAAAIEAAIGFDEAWSNLPAIRASGVADASCAIIARTVLSIVPRYAIGFVTSRGQIDVQAPDEGDSSAYGNAHVLLVNPLGGLDNWQAVATWVRRTGGDKARRRILAGLASERRPDREATQDLLTQAAAVSRKAVPLPPDEGFSAERAAEVGYIYDIDTETLRTWKQRYRSDSAGSRPGRPPKNR